MTTEKAEKAEKAEDSKNIAYEVEGLSAMLDEFREVSYEHWDNLKKAPLRKRIEGMIGYYEMQAEIVLRDTKSFRDTLLIELEAMKLVVENAGNAGTHNEKNARLRGCVEMMESAVKRLANINFDTHKRFWHWPHELFHSDYPVEHYVRRIHELEEELQRYKDTKSNPKINHQ